MGIEIFNPSRFAIGLTSGVQFNNFGNKIHFGQSLEKDSFQSSSPMRLVNETVIKNLIAQNPELKKLLSENKIPIRLNMQELRELIDGHCKTTQEFAGMIAKNLPQALKQHVNLKDLKDAAILHDFGKVLIPPEILNKHGKLTDEEHKIMDLHSIIGYEMLKNSGVNDEVLKLVRFHHNNFEEKGAKRDYIPDINLQILNIADKYSALTEKRVYKEALTPKQALTIIYSDVKKGNVHPFLFQALVKAVTPPQPVKIAKN